MICGVTDHAVVKACERFLGVDVEGPRRDLRRRGAGHGDAELLAEIAARGLADVEAVRAALVPVRNWIVRHGASGARWGGMRFLVSGGLMVTVVPVKGLR